MTPLEAKELVDGDSMSVARNTSPKWLSLLLLPKSKDSCF